MLVDHAGVPSFCSVRSPSAAFGWCFVDQHFRTRWCHWYSIEIVKAVKVSIGRDSWVYATGSQHVERPLCLRDYFIPKVEWEVGIGGGDSSNEIIFERLDGTFCRILSMIVRRYQLVSDVVLFQVCF